MNSRLSNGNGIKKELGCLRARVRQLENRTAGRGGMEKVLLESESKYRTIFENTGTGTILIEADMTISMANAEFEKLSGYSKFEIEGRRRFTDLMFEDDLPMMKEYHEKRRIAGNLAPRNYECRMVDRSGRIRVCYLTVAMIEETGQSVASFMDITDLREAETALRISEEKFAKVYRLRPGVLITTLAGRRCVHVNDTFLALTGYEREEVIGYTTDDLKLWAETSYRRSLIRDLKKEGSIQNQELEFWTKSGEKRFCLFSAEITELQNRPCMVSAVMDITAQRRLEDAILTISEGERRRVGLDLHDDLGQHLIGVEALTTLMEKRLEQNLHPESVLANEIVSLVGEAITKTRNLRKGLCPVNMEEGGFALALKELALQVEKMFKISCRLTCSENVKIRDNSAATHLYHIVREFVNNAVRRAGAKKLFITVDAKEGPIVLTIKGDGVQNSEKVDEKHQLHLNIMKYRAKRIGAALDLIPLPGFGTKLVCTL